MGSEGGPVRGSICVLVRRGLGVPTDITPALRVEHGENEGLTPPKPGAGASPDFNISLDFDYEPDEPIVFTLIDAATNRAVGVGTLNPDLIFVDGNQRHEGDVTLDNGSKVSVVTLFKEAPAHPLPRIVVTVGVGADFPAGKPPGRAAVQLMMDEDEHAETEAVGRSANGTYVWNETYDLKYDLEKKLILNVIVDGNRASPFACGAFDLWSVQTEGKTRMAGVLAVNDLVSGQPLGTIGLSILFYDPAVEAAAAAAAEAAAAEAAADAPAREAAAARDAAARDAAARDAAARDAAAREAAARDAAAAAPAAGAADSHPSAVAAARDADAAAEAAKAAAVAAGLRPAAAYEPARAAANHAETAEAAADAARGAAADGDDASAGRAARAAAAARGAAENAAREAAIAAAEAALREARDAAEKAQNAADHVEQIRAQRQMGDGAGPVAAAGDGGGGSDPAAGGEAELRRLLDAIRECVARARQQRKKCAQEVDEVRAGGPLPETLEHLGRADHAAKSTLKRQIEAEELAREADQLARRLQKEARRREAQRQALLKQQAKDSEIVNALERQREAIREAERRKREDDQLLLLHERNVMQEAAAAAFHSGAGVAGRRGAPDDAAFLDVDGPLPPLCCYIPPNRSKQMRLRQDEYYGRSTATTASGSPDSAAYGVPSPEFDVLLEGERRDDAAACCMCCGVGWGAGRPRN